MLADQDGRCAGCQGELILRLHETNNSGQDLVVDHCHETGKVRGLLCRTCNMGLGQLKDDPARLRRLADYVENSRQTPD